MHKVGEGHLKAGFATDSLTLSVTATAHCKIGFSNPHFVPASFGDDHLGTDLVESLPQLGALQVYSDLSVRAAVVLFRLVLFPAGVSLFGP